MPLVSTKGAASAQGFGEFSQASGSVNYIEDVFSTYLYTGNSSTNTITNSIDLSTKGGLVWIKSRNNAYNHVLTDTVRGVNSQLQSNTSAVPETATDQLTAFSITGFTVGAGARVNETSSTLTSWTFRKQPKFFDIVTWTGSGVARTIAHNLGSAPGCIMVKRTDTVANWEVYHRSLTSAAYSVQLNLTNAEAITSPSAWNSTAPTSTVFSLGTNNDVNASGGTYVAYLFAHNAGGFGLTGTDNVISCGSFTTSAGGVATITLGYEPQFVMIKRTDSTGDWIMLDQMRGFDVLGLDATLLANSSAAETANQERGEPTATGFYIPSNYGNNATYIYIAIRRGPMEVPTVGTSVFSPIASAAAGGTQLTTNFPVDLQMYGIRAGDAANITTSDRLRGVSTTSTAGGNFIVTSSTAAETGGSYTRQWGNTGFVMPAGIGSQDGIFWNFQRAPSFMDVVCYTGTGSNTTQTHNLGVVPELIIVKRRDTAADWDSYSSALANTEYLVVNTNAAKDTGATRWNSTTPTASVFSIGTSTTTNASAGTYVAYLFATCAGVSKVGSYTGTATTLQINCGFTAGSRFVLIKRTDFVGPWYVWDSARGIVAGDDPYLIISSTAAEVTNTDYVDTYNAGFEITSTAPNSINANGGTFIFLAIA